MNLYTLDGVRAPRAPYWRPAEFPAAALELAGPRALQHQRIQRSPLVPSLITDDGHAFAVYFLLKRPHHVDALLQRLSAFFGGQEYDLLPAPPAARLAWKHHVSYTPEQIAQAFPFAERRAAMPLLDAAAERAFVGALIEDPEHFDGSIGLDSLADFHAVRAFEALINVLASDGEVTRHSVRAYVEQQIQFRRSALQEPTNAPASLEWFDALPERRMTSEQFASTAARLRLLAHRRAQAIAAADHNDEIDEFALRDVA